MFDRSCDAVEWPTGKTDRLGVSGTVAHLSQVRSGGARWQAPGRRGASSRTRGRTRTRTVGMRRRRRSGRGRDRCASPTSGSLRSGRWSITQTFATWSSAATSSRTRRIRSWCPVPTVKVVGRRSGTSSAWTTTSTGPTEGSSRRGSCRPPSGGASGRSKRSQRSVSKRSLLATRGSISRMWCRAASHSDSSTPRSASRAQMTRRSMVGRPSCSASTTRRSPARIGRRRSNGL